MEDKPRNTSTIEKIVENYVQNEKTLVKQLHFDACHPTAIGGFREDIWRSMFEQIVPKKFKIEQSVFIIDSHGQVSKEVDLAIFDETYTPYIFRYGRLKFLPIEAVAVVVECKSSSQDQERLKEWAQSIEDLKTSRRSRTRIISGIVLGEEKESVSQSATRPLRIFCCLNNTDVKGGLQSGDPLFDFIIRALADDERLKIEMDEKSLLDWHIALNHAGCKDIQAKDKKTAEIQNRDKLARETLKKYEVTRKDKPVSLLTFNLQLNQLLMLINNPMLFPHIAYAEMFNALGKGDARDD